MPPKKKERPPTNNKFPNTDPVNDAKTTPVNPACKANIEIINSTAFPNVAFNKPPIRGPLTIARLSVARPIKLEIAITVTEHIINIAILDQCKNDPTAVNGTPIMTRIVKIRFIPSLSN